MLTVMTVYGVGFAATFFSTWRNEIDHETVSAKAAAKYALIWPFLLGAFLSLAIIAGLGSIFRKVT